MGPKTLQPDYNNIFHANVKNVQNTNLVSLKNVMIQRLKAPTRNLGYGSVIPIHCTFFFNLTGCNFR